MSADKDYENKGGKIAFIFSMVFSIGFIIFISFYHPGVDLGEVKKEALKKAAKDMVVQGKAEVTSFDVTAVSEPWIQTEEIAQYGESVYKINCAVCHGAKAKGDGPAGLALKPLPRDLIEGQWTAGGGRIELFKTLTSGIEGTSMAGFSHLSVVDRWAIVHFIRNITKNKVDDDDAKVSDFGKSVK